MPFKFYCDFLPTTTYIKSYFLLTSSGNTNSSKTMVKQTQEKKFEHHTDYDLLMAGKSWIFANPTTGCTLDCSYCVEQKDSWFKKEITPIYTADESIEQIKNSPLVLKDKTPLTFYNFSDPFLKANKGDLMKILEALDEDGWTNKVGLISKVHPSVDYLGQLSELKNLKTGLFVSYANLKRGVEKAPAQPRIDMMRDAKYLGIPTVAYARPLVSEWTSEGRLVELAHQIKGNTDAVVLSGLRLTKEIVDSLKAHNVEVPKLKTFTNKEKDKGLFNKATKIISDIAEVPVFWHTSCAMSYLHGEPDYNSHDIREQLTKDSCEFPCVESQRGVCSSRELGTSDEELENIVDRLGKGLKYRRDGNTIYLNGGDVNLEDVSFVRHVVPEFVKKDE